MKTRQTILCGILAVIIALVFTACPEDIDDGEKPPAGKSVPGDNLTAKLAWVLIPGNVKSGEIYVITVNADETIIPFTLANVDEGNITIILWGSGGEKFISPSISGNLFSVGSGVTLVLDNNITLEGISSNNNSLVRVNNGGVLEMRDGAKITGNTASTNAGGVSVGIGGTFTMNGGVISGNTAASSTNYGGGVDTFGAFTMNGGEISGNTTVGYGGGVYVNITGGSFTMNGGEISGNTATTRGGGVYAGGPFRIVTGKISGSNESNESLKNKATEGAALYVIGTAAQRGTFGDDDTWNSTGTLNTTNDTIMVANGALQ